MYQAIPARLFESTVTAESRAALGADGDDGRVGGRGGALGCYRVPILPPKIVVGRVMVVSRREAQLR